VVTTMAAMASRIEMNEVVIAIIDEDLVDAEN
jgi:hypothetical protein